MQAISHAADSADREHAAAQETGKCWTYQGREGVSSQSQVYGKAIKKPATRTWRFVY
jgi:hypothetical protein